MKIGLTGGMGCGKSTATRIFRELGCRTLDSDAIVRDQLLVDPAVVMAAAERFDAENEQADSSRVPSAEAALGQRRRLSPVVLPDGKIDRAELGRRVFADAEALRWLEDLLHPRVQAEWSRQFAEFPDADWVIEVPLLFEKGYEKWFDFTVCVTTTRENQFARLAERGISQALAAQRISKQLPLAQKIELSDFVLSNDGTPDHLREQITHLLGRLRARRQ